MPGIRYGIDGLSVEGRRTLDVFTLAHEEKGESELYKL